MASPSVERRVVRLDAELVGLARAYLEKRARERELIEAALRRGDWETIYGIGHNLRGSGRMFGFAEVSRIGLELQHAAAQGDGERIAELKERLAEFACGTTVKIRSEARPGPRAHSTGSRALPDRHVLVVDDDEMNRMLIAHHLCKAGYAVREAASGEEALAALGHGAPPGLILLDIVMPGRDGFEVCREIRRSPATRSLPVALLSALDRDEDRLRGMEAGADDFLIKPVARDDLLVRVSLAMMPAAER